MSASRSPLYLGVDQSLRSPGFAVVDHDGKLVHVENLKTGSLRGGERLEAIFLRLQRIITDHAPAQAALEGYSVESTNRPFDLGEVGGIARLALQLARVPFVVVAPTQLKKFVTGNGAAEKKDVQTWLERKWSIRLAQDDQADAAGLAQVARTYDSGVSSYRSELEVIKALTGEKKMTLTARGRTKYEI